jgi:hypothetical protein
VAAGDTVYIRGGTYQESVIFYTSGTQAAPITIAGYPGEEAILDGNAYQTPALHSGNALIQVRGDWYTIRDLTFTGSGDQGVTTKGLHDTIENVYSHHNWGWGIWMAGDDDTAQNSRVWSNSMMNENKSMSSGWAGGVTCARYPDGCTIRNTRSWGNWGEGISTFEALHTTLEGNTSYDNQTSNFYISDTKYALVQGNLSYCTPGNKSNPDFIQNGMLVYEELGVPIPLGSGGTRNDSSDNTFLNNIIVGCDSNLFATQKQAANNLYAYNTFVNSSLDRQYYAANVKFQSGTAPNQRFINNLVYQSDAITIVQNDSPGTMSFAHNLWSRAPSSKAGVSGAGDVIGDPQLSMQGSPYSPGWFQLTGSSPAINQGQAIPETNVDFYGADRNALPDIGALEFMTANAGISLVSGWNLVSFDLVPTSTAIADVLSSISGKYDVVYAWDASGAHSTKGNWVKYAPADPAYANTLDSLDQSMGFWIHMNAGATLRVAGTAAPTTTIPLATNAGGWNLVGYPSAGNIPLPDALSGHGAGADYSLVYAYHAYDTGSQWKRYDQLGPAYGNTLTGMSPGWGYWVKVSAAHDWVVSY